MLKCAHMILFADSICQMEWNQPKKDNETTIHVLLKANWAHFTHYEVIKISTPH